LSENIDFTSFPLYNYSATEQDTGKKWTDGRTIYRKTFAGTLNIAQTTASDAFNHGITFTSTGLIVSIQASVTLSSTTGFGSVQLLPLYTGTDRFGFHQVTTTAVQYTASFAWGNSRYWVTLEYIK